MTLLDLELVDQSRMLQVSAVPLKPEFEPYRLVKLTDSHKVEVLQFLNSRPVHTVAMASFLNDNGFESRFNRGIYFGYRAPDGKLEGVALIGHTTLIEARTREALAAFAAAARESETAIHLMMSEGSAIEHFWDLYSAGAISPRQILVEKLFELNFPYLVQDCPWEIEIGDESQLQEIVEAHAEVAVIETGVNPLEEDPDGFTERCRRRIQQGRTFVATENGKLLFKADIVAETDDVIYLEGVYVSPEARGKGVGPKCLAKLSIALLDRVSNICMLSNEKFDSVHRSFELAGYHTTDTCTTIVV
ncbi:MAG: GNAT family N-acetyltransferase [Acidobacteria bacterium]|nr:MAG: GNAT family N-acetyltransferase [Acidobacteriota bacterium]REK02006.1 MAG: GNAT family N-acetyltransferase [Acidobacteriota bacterium]REK14964.1 MAG: GNAT family N-acetyltransferase [Acidobacteriota bacterium]REK45678.1 MAG: GNAT family N-acetyltransferase [Acidobacteriota bacterium]